MSSSAAPDTDTLALRIWDYMHMGHELQPSDVILVLGSNDLRVAEHGAELYLRGLAPRILFSGNVGRLTEGQFQHPEAEAFAEVARSMDVPEEAILIEPRSTNTGENIAFSRELLAGKGIDPEKLIVVQKPYMERRAYATFMNFWPGKDIRIRSPPISFADYPNALLPKDLIITIMVGDLQRIRAYPEKGFQIPQEIPDEVWAAYEELVARGFTGHLIAN
ncbi:MAG: YdcF family protein [Verrucomicrobiales bacterium]|nr:YdcF family protein [Verrucomicrobiales bacterium]